MSDNNTVQLFVTQLKADKKKAALLGIMVVAMIGVYARWLLKAKPADATAAPVPTGAAQNSPAAVTPDASSSMVAPTAITAGPGDAVDATNLARTLSRDLFDTDMNQFSLAPEATAEQNKAASTQPSNPSRLMKGFNRFLNRMWVHGEAVRLENESLLAQMQLQGTILGPSPKATINGRLVREGDIIGGFTVVEIGPRHVTLQKSGCNYRLSML